MQGLVFIYDITKKIVLDRLNGCALIFWRYKMMQPSLAICGVVMTMSCLVQQKHAEEETTCIAYVRWSGIKRTVKDFEVKHLVENSEQRDLICNTYQIPIHNPNLRWDVVSFHKR